VTVIAGVLVPPPLPALPGMLGTAGEGGLYTVTVALPAAPTLAAGIRAVICVEVIVAAGDVSCICEAPRVQFNVEICVASEVLLRKFVPVTVNARLLPAVAQAGETEVTVGIGLAGLSMMNVRVFEKPFVPVP
jgi:hypothetical protein